MKTLRIIVVSFLALIIMAAVAGGVYIRYTSRKALPDYNEKKEIDGLASEVKVYRDSTAMPHIYGKNVEDVYRVTGYVMAQDRMWQMDLLRRLTTGNLSEVLGEDLVEIDQLFRSLHFDRKSKLILERTDPEILAALEAFADGVNHYLYVNRGKLSPEFSILGYQPALWEPEHTVNLIGYMSWGLTMAWSTEIRMFSIEEKLGDTDLFRELIPDHAANPSTVYPEMESDLASPLSFLEEVQNTLGELGLEVFMGSNNWAVAPSKSTTGGAILANDMHLEINAPGIWYQLHTAVPGELDVSGVALPGTPFVVCGHNQDVAWGMTNVMLDDMDFYLETIHSNDSGLYRIDGEWKELRFEEEQIPVKGGDTLTVFNRFTHRGPVISGFKGLDEKVISMRWTGNEFSNEVRSVYLFNRMKNWDDFRDAASSFTSISQNIAYADTEGNIGIQTTAGIPVREGAPYLVYPGDTSLYDWKRILGFEELPYSYNPPSGFVASANNRTIGDEFPWYISNWFDLPNRNEQIQARLEEKERLSVEDFESIQADVYSRWAEKLLPWMLQSSERQIAGASERVQNAFHQLGKWDYRMNVESVPATLFEMLYLKMLEGIYKDELGDTLFSEILSQDLLASYHLDKLRQGAKSAWMDDVSTRDVVEETGDIVLRAMEKTLDELEERLGPEMDQWQWGKVHKLTLKHPLSSVDVLDRAFKLSRGPYPVPGSYHTVSAYSYPLTDFAEVGYGPSHRHIFSTNSWDDSRVIIPGGISGIPASEYYCSQTEAFADYRFKKHLFSFEAVEKAAKYEAVFYPEGKMPGTGVEE